LATVLDAFGIEEEDAHTALGDVRMLSKLLPILLDKSSPLKFSVPVSVNENPGSAPRIKTRVSNLSKGEKGWMANVLKKLPESGQSLTDTVVDNYLEMLNRFLIDGKIIGEEAKELARMAGSSGLGAAQLRKIHENYFASLEKVALEDGVITDAEKKSLASLKSQLGI
jgi:DNA polymerase-3 subunit epsilon